MRSPMKARSTAPFLSVLVAGTMILSACDSQTSTSPEAAPKAITPERTSSFVPSTANKALIGVVDGTYSVTFDPRYNQSFNLGPNHLDIPASSVCNLLTSGYGPTMWNAPCVAQTLPVTMTVIIKGASTNSPQIDFFPAMRFNPAKTVQLFMYVPGATQTDATNWIIKYCATGSTNCIDESKTDASLQSYVDRSANVVFRRIKHFSGYVVPGFNDDSTETQLQ